MMFYNKLKQFYVAYFLLLFPICIIILTCTGAFASYYITIKGMNNQNLLQLVLCVFASMSYLTAVLGQLKKETTFTVLSLALLIEIILLILNLIF